MLTPKFDENHTGRRYSLILRGIGENTMTAHTSTDGSNWEYSTMGESLIERRRVGD